MTAEEVYSSLCEAFEDYGWNDTGDSGRYQFHVWGHPTITVSQCDISCEVSVSNSHRQAEMFSLRDLESLVDAVRQCLEFVTQ